MCPQTPNRIRRLSTTTVVPANRSNESERRTMSFARTLPGRAELAGQSATGVDEILIRWVCVRRNAQPSQPKESVMDRIWTYREDTYRTQSNLAGFDVEATDGSIGSVDEDTTDRDHLIVDTGFWIFGKKRLLPAGVVDRIDYDDRKVYVNLTKDQVKNAPDLDEELDYGGSGSTWDRDPYATYYGPYGW
jgi:hypothetical protein